MTTKEIPSTYPTYPEQGTCYQQDGCYFKGQRILHPSFGLGTVTQVRRDNIHVGMDQDPEEPQGKKARRFPSAPLTLREEMAANNFNLEDMDTLLEWNEEDLEDSLAQLVHGLAKALFTMSSLLVPTGLPRPD